MTVQQSFYEKLLNEIEGWRSEGVITDEQARALVARYRTETEIEKKAGPGRFIATIALLGSVLLGVGVILFFAANWHYIPRLAKLVIIIVSLLSVNYAGYTLFFARKSYPKVGYGLLFLGMLLFGSAIFLVAQAYHIDAHFPNGFLLWLIGIIPMVYLLSSRIGLALAVVVAGVWMGLEASMAYEASGNIALQLTMMYLAYGLFLFAIGRAHGGWSRAGRLEGVYTVFGLAMVLAVTYLLSFKALGFVYGDTAVMTVLGKPFTIYAALVVSAVLLSGYVYYRSGRQDKKTAGVIAFLFVLAAISALHLAFPERAPKSIGNYKEAFLVYPVVYNIILFLEIIGALALGYWERRAAFINTALAFFVLLVGARYFDFFWELLPRSVFFMIGGAILIAGGVLLERKRRNVIETMRTGFAATA